MICNEKEAFSKWCPFARVAMTSAAPTGEAMPPAHNRVFMAEKGVVMIGEPMKCIGAMCMAWQWIEDENPTDDDSPGMSIGAKGDWFEDLDPDHKIGDIIEIDGVTYKVTDTERDRVTKKPRFKLYAKEKRGIRARRGRCGMTHGAESV